MGLGRRRASTRTLGRVAKAAGRRLSDYVKLLEVDPSVSFQWADGERLTLSSDLRRLLERDPDPLSRSAGDVMRPAPRTIAPGELASAALQRMESFRITSLFVVEGSAGDPGGGKLVGIVHLHDLVKAGLS